MTRAQKIEKLLKLREEGRRKYAQADVVLDELVDDMKAGDKVPIKNGKQHAELIDNFAAKNKAFKPCGISRFDLKITDA
jgi:hypothetical protein